MKLVRADYLNDDNKEVVMTFKGFLRTKKHIVVVKDAKMLLELLRTLKGEKINSIKIKDAINKCK